jgi:hypothetical protein
MTAVHWYIARDNNKVGPFTSADLKQLATFGLLKANEMIWTEGLSKWIEASSFPALFPAAGEKRYWLAMSGQTYGPFSADQIQAALANRQITLETQVCLEDAKEWAPLARVPEFQGFTPANVSPSQAKLLTDRLNPEEAELYLAGKSGDAIARLITTLLDLKKAYAANATLAESLEKSIEVLRARRAEEKAAMPSVQRSG